MNNNTMTEIQTCWVEDLLLDPQNPRLARTLVEASQEELLLALYRTHDLEPLILSLSQSGYFTEEPLIGVRQSDAPDENVFVIVEGNRRLAALKVLLLDWAQHVVGMPGLPELSEGIRGRLNPVPVKEYPTRADVIPYLGVRHIRGVKDWDALAKARYVEQLIIEDYSIRSISRLVGDRGDVVRRWLHTLYVLDQANSLSNPPWNESPGEFKFSWLYTALGYANVREYLGLAEDARQNPTLNPVKPDHIEFLIDHMNDLYGPPPGDPHRAKVPESRAIRSLAACYGRPESIDILRGGGTLEDAYARSSGEQEELLDNLRRSNVSLERANAMAHRHRQDGPAIEAAVRAAGTADNIVKVLKG